MAGAIDLYSGYNSISGVNLFKVDKNPLEQLDMGIASMVKRADSISGSITSIIQALIDAILGGVGHTLADLADFFLHLPQEVFGFLETLTGLDLTHGLAKFFDSLTLGFNNWATATLKWLKDTFGLDFTGPIKFVESIFTAILKAFETLTGLDLTHGLLAFFTSLTEDIAKWQSQVWTWLTSWTNLNWSNGPLPFLVSVFNAIISAIETQTGLEINSGLPAFFASLNTVIHKWQADVQNFLKTWTNIDFSDPFKFIDSLIKQLFSVANGAIIAGQLFVDALIKQIFGTLQGVATAGWNFVDYVLHAIFGTGFDQAKGFVDNLLKSFFGTLQGVATAGWNFIDYVIHWITNDLPGAVTNQIGLFTAICNKLLSGTSVSDLLGLVGGPNGTNIGFSGLTAYLQVLIDTIWNAFSYLLGGQTGQSGKTLYDIPQLFINWLVRIPLVGSIVKAITGIDLDFYGTNQSPIDVAVSTLTKFFSPLATGAASIIDGIINTIKQVLRIPASGNLFEWIGTLLNPANILAALNGSYSTALATVPVSHVNTDKVNLLNLGDFKNSATLTYGNGWSWDSSENYTQLGGGTAKTSCSGSNVPLYCNQNIRVGVGDKISASAFIKTATFNGNASSIAISLIPFAGAVQKPTVVLVARGASNGAWGAMSSESTPWQVPVWSKTTNGVTAGTGATASDQITSIQVMLSVGSSATTGVVWWDDVWLWKSGLLGQPLVNNLPGAFGGLFDGLNGYAAGTNASLEADQSNLHTAATVPAAAASTATTAATAATTNTQTVTNAIATTVGAQPTGVNYSPTLISTHFSDFFTKLYGQNTPKSTITSTAIAAGSITGGTGGHLGGSTIDSTNLGGRAVRGSHIDLSAVETKHIIATGLTNAAIAADAIQTTNLLDGNVTGAKTAGLDAGKITGGTLAAGYVGNLPAGKITSGTFGNNFIGLEAIDAPNIKPRGVRGSHIQLGDITGGTGGHLSTTVGSQIVSSNLADLAVTGAKTSGLDAGKITSGTVAAGYVGDLDAGKITSGTFGGTRIAGRAIDGTKIVLGTIQGGASGHLSTAVGSQVDGNNIAAAAVKGTHVDLATLTGANIASTTLETKHIAAAGLGNAAIAVDAIANANVQALAITGAKTSGLDAGKITGGTLAAGYIGDLAAGKITSGTFGNAFIATDAIDSINIKASAVTSGKIGGRAVGSSHIVLGAISGGTAGTSHLSTTVGSQIVSGNLEDLAVTGGKTSGLDAGKITGGTLAAGYIGDFTSAKVTDFAAAAKSAAGNTTPVGSGLILTRSSTATPAYLTKIGQNGLSTGFYNVQTSAGSDITYTSNSGGYYAVTIVKAGWYSIELSFLLNGQSSFAYNWFISPLFFKTNIGNYYKIGTAGCYNRDYAMGASCAQANWTEYLAAGEVIYPGYLYNATGGLGGNASGYSNASIINSVGSNYGTHFSMSLLNRS